MFGCECYVQLYIYLNGRNGVTQNKDLEQMHQYELRLQENSDDIHNYSKTPSCTRVRMEEKLTKGNLHPINETDSTTEKGDTSTNSTEQRIRNNHQPLKEKEQSIQKQCS